MEKATIYVLYSAGNLLLLGILPLDYSFYTLLKGVVSVAAVLLELERRGVIVSSGSACAAGSDDPSHVLLAIGIEPEVAQTAIRFSFSHETTDQELTDAATALVESVKVFL